MRSHPRRAGLPGRRHPVLRLRPLGRDPAPLGRRRGRGRGRRHGRPSPASTSPCARPVRPRRGSWRPAGRRRRRRHRQLLGLAHGPRRPARRPRGERGSALEHDPKGIVANPNCTDMVAMPVLKPLARRGRPPPDWSSPPTRRSRVPGRPAWPSWPSSWRRPSDEAAELTFDGGAVDFPAPDKFAAPIAHNVVPHGRLPRRRRLRRDRRGAEVPQREPQDPRAARPGRHLHLRPGPRVHRPLDGDRRRVRSRRSRPSGRERAARRRAGRRAHRHPDAAARRRRRPVAGRSGPPGRPTASRSSSCGDNLRKGAALNAVQIAEALLELRF